MDPAGGPPTHDAFRRLGRAESLPLLASARVGRLIFTVWAMPAVRVMNFALVDRHIVLRTAANTTVARSVDNAIVAFEVDDLDVATSSGWSVTVTGRASLVTDPELIRRYQMVPLVPWASGLRDQYVTITTEKVEGQRVSGPGALPSPALRTAPAT
jgi:uncharacterized protein